MKGDIWLLAIGIVMVITAFTLTCYLAWRLINKPVECVDGKAYKITIQGDVKYLDEVHGTKCEELR